VAVRLAILELPAGARGLVAGVDVDLVEVLGRQLVRNGKPWMVTCGLPDRASDDWNWLAIWSSAYAFGAPVGGDEQAR